MQVPPALKPVLSYIKRAEELDADTSNPNSATVAFFCRSYAVQRALELRQEGATGDDVTNFLVTLMGRLEADKATVPNSTPEAGQPIMEEFARSVFKKADDEDRAGVADKGTARTFYAAGSFLDTLQQFGELSPEVAQMKKYAKWKAGEIITAIRDGRPIQPGGFEDTSGVDVDAGGAAGVVPVVAAEPLPPPAAAPGGVSALDSLIPQAPTGLPPIAQAPPPAAAASAPPP
eukprot:CAMPEP_0198422618 /NCGR_PEP_ID=MMETSP1452-20131203/2517_1 /TAXON_ID=1181717 /ORGANISM="Synchroma pusillum, Strain CCMP3072" /LENGTH=231 /DNA_ID=CAMNT_0044142891 /DNA_START=23 /DNA_END=714 /DNA_ORIENTATION=-